MKRQRILPVAFLLLGLLLLSHLRYKTGNITDDAFITYRYARNLADGNGLVYNAGERVLGATTPLYAILMAGCIRLGLIPWQVSLILDILFTAGIFLIIHRFASAAGRPAWAWLSFILIASNPFSLFPVGGMETGLFFFLVFAAFYCLTEERFRAAAFCALLTLFTRPEGILTLALVLPFALLNPRTSRLRKGFRKTLLIVLVPLIAAALLLSAYYGDIVPNSVRAKQARVEQEIITHNYMDWFWGMQYFTAGDFQIVAILEWIGLALMVLLIPAMRLPVLWFLLYLLFMDIGRAPMHLWYDTPPWYFRMMGLGMSLHVAARLLINATGHVIQKFSAHVPVRSQERSPVVFALSALLLFLLAPALVAFSYQIHLWAHYSGRNILDCKQYDRAALWVKEHSEPDEEILALEIGYVGWFSERPIFDPMGLISPEAIAYPREHTMWHMAVERQTPWIIFPFNNRLYTPVPNVFTGRYRIMRVFRTPLETTIVFRRDESSSTVLPENSAGWDRGIRPRLALDRYVTPFE